MFRILLLAALAATGIAFSPIVAAPPTKYLSASSSAAAVTMAQEVKVGDRIPSVVLKEGQADYGTPKDVNIAELIAGKKVAIFAVPGAFTPGEYVVGVYYGQLLSPLTLTPRATLHHAYIRSHRASHLPPRLLEVALAQLHDRTGRSQVQGRRVDHMHRHKRRLRDGGELRWGV